MRRQGAIITLVVLLGSNPAQARPLMGIIGIDAPGEQEDQLGIMLPRSPALSQRWLILGPGEVRIRLAKATSIQTPVVRARSHLSQARQELAQMERSRAISAASQAIAELTQVAGRYHVADLLSQAHLILAQARLLHPSDPERTLSDLRAALKVSPNIQPDPRQMPPRLVRLLQQAQTQAPAPDPPTDGEMALLAKAARIPHLLWLGIRAEGEQRKVTILIHDLQQQMLDRRQQTIEADKLNELLPSLVLGALNQVQVAAQPEVRHNTSSVPLDPLMKAHADISDQQRPDEPRQPVSRPWYKRWWVWTLAGVVVVGASVTAGVVLTRGDRSYDVMVRF